MTLDLSDVTLCAADSVNPWLAARALHRSMAGCRFADAILFSHAPVEGSFRNVEIARLGSSSAYSAFILEQLPALTVTPFVLIVQWDGYVLSPAAWQPEFRDYDYIGAKWDWYDDGMTVGNGGFSLRSRKLLAALTDPRFAAVPGHNEDNLICRTYRPALERDYGIRFAPDRVADRFSYERSPPAAPTFGFHGLFNMWHHLDSAEMIEAVGHMHPYLCRTGEYAELIAHCVALKRFGPVLALYSKLRAELGQEGAARAIIDGLRDDEMAQQCLALGEELVRREAFQSAVRNLRAFGDTIRTAREAKGWSSMRLAAKVGVGVKILHNIEAGNSAAEPKVRKRLLAVLEIADG
jgi:hypothetical protein